jgi:hypothetical protein
MLQNPAPPRISVPSLGTGPRPLAKLFLTTTTNNSLSEFRLMADA